MTALQQSFVDYFRCPPEFSDIRLRGELAASKGFFRFGPDAVCYGRLSSGRVESREAEPLDDVLALAIVEKNTIYVPFDCDEIVNNLRWERYLGSPQNNGSRSQVKKLVRNAYYLARPLLPVSVRKYLQRIALRGWDSRPFPRWPVDQSVDALFERMMVLALQASKTDRIPFIWFWPEGKSSCATMTHDVETAEGRDFCPSLMDLNDSFGIKSAFQLVPEQRYSVSEAFLQQIRERGFEVNVHDLNHDGNLFRERGEFLRRAAKINEYCRKFGAAGYRSGVLYRNLDWYDAFEFSYDMSVPNVGHLDPQPGGCCTSKPYFIGKILEIPVTATQDYTLFNILQQYSTDLWKQQIQMIHARHGLASFIVHPDYLNSERSVNVYSELLRHLSDLRARENTWIALPGQVAEWWRLRSAMTLTKDGNSWRVEGKGHEQAHIAYAFLANDKLAYEFLPELVRNTAEFK
jgi:hypothetical protein